MQKQTKQGLEACMCRALVRIVCAEVVLGIAAMHIGVKGRTQKLLVCSLSD